MKIKSIHKSSTESFSMLKKYFFIILTSIGLFFSCAEPKNEIIKSKLSSLQTALASKNPKIKTVIDALDAHEIQIIYTEIERKNDSLKFIDHIFQLDSTQYFFPASTVKLPISVLTLAKLNTIPNMNRDTRFFVEGDTLETTFAKEIEKALIVDDNEAYNRLFEFLGQDYINKELENIGLKSTRISNRIATENSEEITTKPLVVFENDSTTTILNGTINTSARSILKNKIKKGIGFYEEDSLMNEPFDFSLKNYYPIKEQHQLLKTLMFSEKYKAHEKLNLTKEQLSFIHSTLNTIPKKQGYDPIIYHDSYCKYFMFGDHKENIPEHIKIYNKTGKEYGTLTETAYIIDNKNNIEFMISATILANKNGIFNDDSYEYEEIGIPFLAQLGRELNTIELNQK